MRLFGVLVILPLLTWTSEAVTFRQNYQKDSNSEASEIGTETSGFDGFGGFGGFKGFHQINGFMSHAFGDLDGQFDSTGFAGAQSKKFDSGYGQHFLEDIDHETFASELVSPTEQKEKEQSRLAGPLPSVSLATHKLPGLHQYLPTSSNRRPQETTERKSYSVSKFTQTKQPYRQDNNKQVVSQNKNRPQVQRVAPNHKVYGSVLPATTKTVYPSVSYKYPPRSQQNIIPAPTHKKPTVTFTNTNIEKQTPEGFTFGPEKFYQK